MKRQFIGLAIFCACYVVPIASAVDYTQLMAPQSALTFEFKQMGVAMEGRFKRFNSQIAFDPAHPLQARARFDIDIASIETDSGEADDQLQSVLWFNARSHPQATFVSSAVQSRGANRYEVQGYLTMKGKTLPVRTSMLITPSQNGVLLSGEVPIKRRDYGIGEKHWADVGTVADEVKIRFRFLVTANSDTPSPSHKNR